MNYKKFLAGFAFAASFLAGTANASGLVISQVYGGGGNTAAPYTHDFIEIFNGDIVARNLGGLSLQYGSATGTGNLGASAAQLTVLPTITLQPGQYYLVQQASQAPVGVALPTPDLAVTTNPIAMSGSAGKVALVTGVTSLGCNGGSTPCNAAALARIIDLVGYGTANFFEGTAAPLLTNTTSAARALGGCTDTGSNASDFASQLPSPRNSSVAFAPCGSTGPATIVASCPAINSQAGSAAFSALRATDTDSRVTAASLASGTPIGFSLSSFVGSTADGDDATVSLDVDSSVAPGSYTVVVNFSNDDSQVGSCSVSVSLQNQGLTPIYTIQGSGTASPFAALTAPQNVVTTEGVITKRIISQLSPLTLQGFFMQDEAGDSDDNTSDGIYVFTNGAAAFNGVTEGQRVRLTGTVIEFNTFTQITNPSAPDVRASNVVVAPKLVVLPELVAGELERYEGMLITINQTMTVAQNFFQGRYGQVTVSAGGRMFNPTNIYAANSPQAIALSNENARRRLILDDGNSFQNPNPIPYIGLNNTTRAGDTVASLTGVLDHGLVTSGTERDYRLHPTVTPVFTRANARTLVPQAVGGSLRVASFNVLNFFTTIDGGGSGCFPSGTATDCRGADSAAEFQRQRDKIVDAMLALNADVIGLIEIENNGQVAVNNLVAALNAKFAISSPGTTYASIGVPTGGTGTDAIRQAMIYKVGKVVPFGAALSDTNAAHNRPPLAQTFLLPNAERFTVIVNHFKSKSCSGVSGIDNDQNDGQACFNNRRLLQSQALLQFISSLQSSNQPNKVLVIGDLNAYAKEDPIAALVNGGLSDQIGRFDPTGTAYSYVFNGEAGTLDHALATASLAPSITGVNHWKINADEPSVIDYNTEFKPQDLYSANPYRSSDHDPVVVGISLLKTIAGTASRDTLVGTAGDDLITGGAGADLITTGAGFDVIAYNDIRDAGDTITDFAPGSDKIDLRALLVSLGINSATAITNGHVRFATSAQGTVIQIDPDGTTGPLAARTYITLRDVSLGSLVVGRDLFL